MSVVQDIDYLAVAPPLVVALVAVAVLVVDALLPAARRAVTGWLALGGLVVAAQRHQREGGQGHDLERHDEGEQVPAGRKGERAGHRAEQQEEVLA